MFTQGTRRTMLRLFLLPIMTGVMLQGCSPIIYWTIQNQLDEPVRVSFWVRDVNDTLWSIDIAPRTTVRFEEPAGRRYRPDPGISFTGLASNVIINKPHFASETFGRWEPVLQKVPLSQKRDWKLILTATDIVCDVPMPIVKSKATEFPAIDREEPAPRISTGRPDAS